MSATRSTYVQERPLNAYLGPIVAGLAWPAIMLEAQNILTFVLAKSNQLGWVVPVGYLCLSFLAVLCFIIAWAAKEGFVAVLIGEFIGLLIETRFRGAGLRSGTFEFFERPMSVWSTSFLVTCVAGAMLGGVWGHIRPGVEIQTSKRLTVVTACALFAIATASAIATLAYGAANISSFAPTKYLILFLMTALAVTAWIFQRRGDD